MKTPISYYGGKQTMLPHILPLIPAHQIYIEPFFGGGAVFWAKPLSPSEVINDTNNEVVNFYRQIQLNFNALQEAIQATPYSRLLHDKAFLIYTHPQYFTDLERAWAFWVQTNLSYSSSIGSGLTFDKENKGTLRILNKRLAFVEALQERLAHTCIENQDANLILRNRDCEKAFFYIDPPYVNSYQGHYKGYTPKNLYELLQTLATIKGKFLLSSYYSPELQHYANEKQWKIVAIQRTLSASAVAVGAARRKVTEALIYNYETPNTTPAQAPQSATGV